MSKTTVVFGWCPSWYAFSIHAAALLYGGLQNTVCPAQLWAIPSSLAV